MYKYSFFALPMVALPVNITVVQYKTLKKALFRKLQFIGVIK
jgi:hypothetical protein